MRYLKTNTATIVTVGPFYDKTDGVTIETALTITNERITFVVDNNDGSAPTLVLDNVTGATSGTSNDLNYITNCDAGLMQLELAAANVNYLGRAMLTITDAANHCPVFHEFMILPAMVFDSLIAGTDVMQADMTQILGTAVSTPATAGLLDVNAIQLSGDATAANNAESFFDGTGYAGTNNVIPTVTTVGTTTNLTNLPAAAATADELAKVPKSDGTTSWNATALAAINAEVDTALNTAIPGSPTANSVNERIATMDGLLLGTVAAGTHNPQSGDAFARLGAPAGASVSADVAAVKSQTAAIETDTQDLQAQVGTDGAGLTAIGDTRLANLDAAVSSRSTYAGGAVASVTGAVGSVTGNVGGSVASVAANGITATSIAADAINAAAVKADAVTKIQNGLATPTNITAGTITTVTNLTNAPTAGDLTATMKASVTTAATAATPTAAAVTGAVGSVTAPVTAGTVSDKTGYALSSAGVQAIWDALTSALTTAGSVGKRIADYLDVAVSSRGTSTYAGGDTSGTTTLLSRIVGTLATGTHSPQSGDSYARLGAPAGASVSADVAEVKTLTDGHGTLNYNLSTSIYNLLNTEIADILADTNELQTDWANGGRLDLLLDAASSAGDPWATALPGAYGAGTAGKLIGDNINAPIATIDTVVDAIKAKTDALPTDPADQSAVEAAITAATSGLATAAALATVAGYVDTEVAAILAAVDTEVAAIKAKTDNLPASPAAVGSAMTLTSAYDAAKTAATQTSVDDLPTNAELATALAGADDATLAAIAALNNLSSAQVQTAATAALNAYDPPTNAEMEARTLLAASYFDPATDTVARVTLVDTTTTNTDMVAAAPSAADIKTALEADGSKLDHLWEMTEDDAGVRRLTANALEEAPAGGGGGTADWTAGEREQIRYRLQLDGTQTAPADPDLPAVNVTMQAGVLIPGPLALESTAQAILEDTGTTLPGTLATIAGYIDTEVAAILAAVDTEVAAILADTNELQTDLVNGGRLDLLIDAIKAKTDNLPTDPADQSAVEAAITAATSGLATAANLATLAAYVDTEVAAILADTNELQTDWANGGRLDLILDARASQTSVDDLPTNSELATALAGADDAVLSAIAALPTDADVQTAAAAALTAYDPPTNAEMEARTLAAASYATSSALDAVDNYIDTEVAAIKATTDKLDTALVLDGAVYQFTTNALELAPTGGGVAPTVVQIRQEIDANSTQLAAIVEDTGTTLPATLATISGYVDTEVAAIKAKTDNLPSDPADQSAVEAAITSAVSLLALEATAQAIIVDVAAIPADVDTQLSGVHGAGSWESVTTGGGARTVVVTVDDGTNPLQNAKVRLSEGVNTFTGSTNVSGQLTFNVDDASYSVAITKAGYTYAGTTLVVDSNETVTYSMAAVTVTASDPAQATGWVYCYDDEGNVEADVSISVQLTATPETDSYAFDTVVRVVTSEADGLAQFTGLWIGATYRARRYNGPWYSFVVPNAASFALPVLLGR